MNSRLKITFGKFLLDDILMKITVLTIFLAISWSIHGQYEPLPLKLERLETDMQKGKFDNHFFLMRNAKIEVVITNEEDEAEYVQIRDEYEIFTFV